MAVDGLRPVAAIYSTFLQRAYDIVAHDIALQKIPITFAIDRGGVVGDDGPTHHGTFDFSYLRHLPDMIVSAPMDENEMRDLLYSSIYYDDGPWSLRYPRGAGEGVELRKDFQKIEPGTGVLLREGNDILLLGIGREVYRCMEAAEELAGEGIEAAVINARFVKPLDEELILEWAKKTGKVLTVEDHNVQGGFGSAVLELLNEKKVINEIKLVLHGYPDEFVPQATPTQIYQEYGLDGPGIAKKAREML
jgi:1-deoxy-D-xylulose-5-phosphate synthase